jgi:hypothetical protein
LCGETRPAVGDVVIDRQDSVGEAHGQFTIEPRFQSDASSLRLACCIRRAASVTNASSSVKKIVFDKC